MAPAPASAEHGKQRKSLVEGNKPPAETGTKNIEAYPSDITRHSAPNQHHEAQRTNKENAEPANPTALHRAASNREPYLQRQPP